MIDAIRDKKAIFRMIKAELSYAGKYQNTEKHSLYEIKRLTHSIEKGISIKEPRLGFGKAKIEELIDRCSTFLNRDATSPPEEVKMALSALQSYLIHHDDRGFADETTQVVRAFLKEHPAEAAFGGVIHLNKDEIIGQIPISDVEKLIRTRHSIRNFSQQPVNIDTIISAAHLAQWAPSACNRQGVKLYIVDKKDRQQLDQWLSSGGTKGFTDDIDKYLFVTGDRSAYREKEYAQFIVSAGIYVGYLTLTLHAYGLGACIVQQPVLWNESANKLAQKLGIPETEQIICMLAVGNLPEELYVPISHRMGIDEIIKVVDLANNRSNA